MFIPFCYRVLTQIRRTCTSLAIVFCNIFFKFSIGMITLDTKVIHLSIIISNRVDGMCSEILKKKTIEYLCFHSPNISMCILDILIIVLMRIILCYLIFFRKIRYRYHRIMRFWDRVQRIYRPQLTLHLLYDETHEQD